MIALSRWTIFTVHLYIFVISSYRHPKSMFNFWHRSCEDLVTTESINDNDMVHTYIYVMAEVSISLVHFPLWVSKAYSQGFRNIAMRTQSPCLHPWAPSSSAGTLD